MKTKYSLEFAQELAKKKNGKCLSDHYKNATEKMEWQCSIGHIWKTNLMCIKAGLWCPQCSSRLGERITKTFFEQLFEAKFEKVRPNWLKNSRNNTMELDGYCAELNLAFEHNGAQHYTEKSIYCDDLKLRQQDDQEKLKLCKEKNITLIIIPEIIRYTPIDQIKKCIKDQLIENNYLIPKDFDNKQIDLSSCYLPVEVEKYKRLQNAAKNKNGKLLTKTYLGRHSEYEWECNICKEKFTRKAHTILNNRGWCPKCSKKRKPTKEELISLAERKKGKCLNPEEYINYSTMLKWQCECGYIWEASTFVIKNLNHWCHKCAKQVKPSTDVIQNLAKKRNGICLSPEEYINAKTKNLLMKCEKGHEWLMTYLNLYGGRWCPICANERKGKKTNTIEQMHILAKQMGGKCLTKKYINCGEKIKWQCGVCDHIWESSFYSVKNKHWCPKCSKNAKITNKDIESILKEQNLICLNCEEYSGYYVKNLKIKYKNGEIKTNSIANIMKWIRRSQMKKEKK